MAETCVADTGPLLHLEEIRRLEAVAVFDCIFVSSLIARELRKHSVDTSMLQSRLPLSIRRVLRPEAEARQMSLSQFRIGVEDASCLVLAQKVGCSVVLTDDLELRKAVEAGGGTPVGSVGILVKNFVTGRWDEAEFREAVEKLLNESTLFMSIAFREYVQRKVESTVRAQKRKRPPAT